MKVLKKNEMIKLREQWMMMGVISNPALKPIADEAKSPVGTRSSIIAEMR